MGTKWDAFDQLDIFNIWVCPKIQDALKMAINKEKNMIKPNGEMCEIGPEIESSTAEHCGTSIIIQKCNRPRPHFITCHD